MTKIKETWTAIKNSLGIGKDDPVPELDEGKLEILNQSLTTAEADVAAKEAEMTTMKEAHTTELAAKDAEIAKLKAEVAAAKEAKTLETTTKTEVEQTEDPNHLGTQGEAHPCAGAANAINQFKNY